MSLLRTSLKPETSCPARRRLYLRAPRSTWTISRDFIEQRNDAMSRPALGFTSYRAAKTLLNDGHEADHHNFQPVCK